MADAQRESQAALVSLQQSTFAQLVRACLGLHDVVLHAYVSSVFVSLIVMQEEKSSRNEALSVALATATAQLAAAEADRVRLEAIAKEKVMEVARLLEEARASGDERARLAMRVEAADSVASDLRAQLAASETHVKALMVSCVADNSYLVHLVRIEGSFVCAQESQASLASQLAVMSSTVANVQRESQSALSSLQESTSAQLVRL